MDTTTFPSQPRPSRCYTPVRSGALVRGLPGRPASRGLRGSAALTALSVVVVALLTGCGGSSTGATLTGGTGGDPPAAARDCLRGSSLTLIIPVHQGAQAAALPQQWQCAIESAIISAKPINIVTAEGKPQVVLRNFIAKISTINPEALNDDLIAAQNTVLAAAGHARATSNGDDLLSTLSLAADLSSTSGADGQIMSIDNGLSDSGVVRMADDGMTGAGSKEVASFVTSNKACPNLRGKTVLFHGLAYGVAPQLPLSQRQRDAVSSIWTEVAKICGAARAEAVALPRTGVGPSTTFTTKPVTPEKPPVMKVAPAASIRVSDNSALGFVVDSDRLRDPAGARDFLADLAKQLKSSPAIHVTLVGSTSKGATAWPSLVALSQARAVTVAHLLTGMGVRSSQLSTKGVGYRAQPPVTDPATAALNRAVTLTFS
jgi:outer membrane protein OmpA-like peptidoglycan-associated protein